MLEGPWRRAAADPGVEAEAVQCHLTVWAGTADVANPFDADAVANLDQRCIHIGAEFDDYSNTFVSSHLARVGGLERCGPVIGHDVEIRVTDPRVSSVVVSL